MKAVKTWILVADAARARVFLNDGPGHGITELTAHGLESDLKPSRDINADRPGRSFDSGGQGRHAMEPSTDPNRHQKFCFAKEVASMIAKAHHARSFDRIVMIAPPSTLGDLRSALPKTVAGAVHGEIAKDLTYLNAKDLAGHLGDVLAV